MNGQYAFLKGIQHLGWLDSRIFLIDYPCEPICYWNFDAAQVWWFQDSIKTLAHPDFWD